MTDKWNYNTQSLRNGDVNYRYWSDEEVNRLAKLTQNHSAQECADILGRSLKSVKQAALVRGFSFRKNPRRAFSTADDLYIRNHVGLLSTRQIANKLGRTFESIKSRIKRLGLSNSYKPCVRFVYSDEDIELCRQLSEAGLSYGEIGRKMEISASHVARVCQFEARAGYLPDYIFDISDRT